MIEKETNQWRQVKHKNVIKFLDCNTNLHYPQYENDASCATVLLTYEYLGGELMNIMCFNRRMRQDIARTYFHQLIDGLDALHTMVFVIKEYVSKIYY